ncbi:MAG: hypothetical protein KC910_04425, partial [Candidatus Eremiobacteraeota bacterium]|nr:hypothetical protein [Candidatus Eremiobacteraeota bacterium]
APAPPEVGRPPAPAPAPKPVEPERAANNPTVLAMEVAEETSSTPAAPGVLTHADHLALQQQASARGVHRLQLQGSGGVTHVVNIHGATPAELKTVQKALAQFAAVDPNGMVMPLVKDVYMVDDLGKSRETGRDVLGTAVKSGDQTSISLARMASKGLKKNPLESLNHVKKVLYHEMGHAADNRYGLSTAPFGQGDPQAVGPDGDFVSAYAAVNKKEDWAECFSEFFQVKTCAGSLTDEEAISMAGFGSNGRGQYLEKLEAVPRHLSADKALTSFLPGWLHQQPDLSIRDMLSRYQDDGAFRADLTGAIKAFLPALPESSLQAYMRSKCELMEVPWSGLR